MLLNPLLNLFVQTETVQRQDADFCDAKFCHESANDRAQKFRRFAGRNVLMVNMPVQLCDLPDLVAQCFEVIHKTRGEVPWVLCVLCG